MLVLKTLLEFATHILLQRRRYVTLVGPLTAVGPLTIISNVFILKELLYKYNAII